MLSKEEEVNGCGGKRWRGFYPSAEQYPGLRIRLEVLDESRLEGAGVRLVRIVAV